MTNLLALVAAIALFEHRGEVCPNAVGRDGDIGPLQITAVMARDVARITKTAVRHEDMTDWATATNAAGAFFAHYGKGRWTPEQCAAAWNVGPDMCPWPTNYVRGVMRYYNGLREGTIMFDGRRAVAVDVRSSRLFRPADDYVGIAADYIQPSELLTDSELTRASASELITWLQDERLRGASICAWNACAAFRVIGEYARRLDDAARLALSSYDVGLNMSVAKGWSAANMFPAAERGNGLVPAKNGTAMAARNCLRVTTAAAATGVLNWVTVGGKYRATHIPALLSVEELLSHGKTGPSGAWLYNRLPFDKLSDTAPWHLTTLTKEVTV